MHMKMTASVSVGAIIYFIRMKSFVESSGCLGHICHKTIPFLITDIHDLTYMVFIGHNTPSRFTLLLKQDQLAHVQIADLNAEFIQQFPSHTICAIIILHRKILPSALISLIIITLFPAFKENPKDSGQKNPFSL